MALPASGTISILDIYNEAQLSASSPWYNKGYSLGAYRGIQWWQDNTATGYFSSGAISMSDFYSKRSTSPVTPGSKVFQTFIATSFVMGSGSATFSYNGSNAFSINDVINIYSTNFTFIGTATVTAIVSSNRITVATSLFFTISSIAFINLTSFIVPLYSALTIVTRGGGGGGGGSGGVLSAGGNGASGGTSSFGAINSAPGGGGGQGSGSTIGAAGAGSDGSPAGGAGAGGWGVGSTNGANGGSGGKTTTVVNNPLGGGSGPSVGSSITVTLGFGGAGGSAGSGYDISGNVKNGSFGGTGGNGYIEVYWS